VVVNVAKKSPKESMPVQEPVVQRESWSAVLQHRPWCAGGLGAAVLSAFVHVEADDRIASSIRVECSTCKAQAVVSGRILTGAYPALPGSCEDHPSPRQAALDLVEV